MRSLSSPSVTASESPRFKCQHEQVLALKQSRLFHKTSRLYSKQALANTHLHAGHQGTLPGSCESGAGAFSSC